MKRLFIIIVFLVLALGWLLLPGCGTVTPDQVHSNTASFDGTNQNSGLIEFLPNGSALITPHARERYNGLVAIYGKKFIPPLLPDDGVRTTGGLNWIIDPQHFNYFKAMNRWRKEGK